MALRGDFFLTSGICKFVHVDNKPRNISFERNESTDFNKSSRLNFNQGLSLRSCSESHLDRLSNKADDRSGKVHALPSHWQSAKNSEILVEENKLVNGYGALQGSNLRGTPKQFISEKLVVAVDIDEVLGSFVSPLNKFLASKYSLNHTVSEYHVYEFCKVWNCSPIEADMRVHEFFKTPYFQNEIHPIPGARKALLNLSSYCKLSVVTSRQNAIKKQTLDWLGRHYPDLFEEVHFGNHFALNGKSRPKSEICRSLGAHVLIDDNPQYALECARAGIKVLLFDHNNSYPWSKIGSATLHPLVIKIHNWQEVEQQILSWVTSDIPDTEIYF